MRLVVFFDFLIRNDANLYKTPVLLSFSQCSYINVGSLRSSNLSEVRENKEVQLSKGFYKSKACCITKTIG
jgi:hypothetical protein